MEKQIKRRVILSMRMAAELARMGNPLIERIPNIHKPEFDVFVFENTKKLNQDIKTILQGRIDK